MMYFFKHTWALYVKYFIRKRRNCLWIFSEFERLAEWDVNTPVVYVTPESGFVFYLFYLFPQVFWAPTISKMKTAHRNPMNTYICSDIHSLSVHQVKHIFSNSIRLKRLNNAWFSLCRTQILSKTRPRDPVSKFRLCVAVPDIWAPLPELGSRDHMLDL